MYPAKHRGCSRRALPRDHPSERPAASLRTVSAYLGLGTGLSRRQLPWIADMAGSRPKVERRHGRSRTLVRLLSLGVAFASTAANVAAQGGNTLLPLVSRCPAGTGGTGCRPCEAGTWSAGGTAAALTQACQACPTGTTTANASATASSQCSGKCVLSGAALLEDIEPSGPKQANHPA